MWWPLRGAVFIRFLVFQDFPLQDPELVKVRGAQLKAEPVAHLKHRRVVQAHQAETAGAELGLGQAPDLPGGFVLRQELGRAPVA